MTPLVLLPGMMCDARLFTPQIKALPIHRPISVGSITGHDSIEALAIAVLQNAPPRFALAGLSMGGIVAMQIMVIAPERVERLALLDTNPNAELCEVSENRKLQIAKVREGRLDEVMRDEMKPLYLSDGSQREEHLDLCMEMALTLGDDVFIRQSTALASRPDQTEALKNISVPTLVLCGRDDFLCPVERHQLMHELIPNSSLAVVEGAGHLPTIEKPVETNRLLFEWLAG